MAAGIPHRRTTVLLVAALLSLGSAFEFGVQQFLAADEAADFRPEIIVGTVVDSNGLVRRAYDVYFEWLNRNGGISIGGVTWRATLQSLNPRSQNGTIEEVETAANLLISGGRIFMMLGSGNAVWDEVVARVCHESNILFIIPLLAPANALHARPTVFGLGTQGDKLLAGAMTLLAGRSAGAVHVISEDAAWAQEVCGVAGSFGIPMVTNVTVAADASTAELSAVLGNSSLQLNLHNTSGDVIVACVSSRPMCQKLVTSMVQLDYNVEAVAITNCIEADMLYDVDWQPRWNTWVVGVDSWTPNLTKSTTVTKLWDGNYFAEAYNQRYSTYLVRKEYAAGMNAAWLLVRAMEAADTLNVTELVGWLSTMNEDTDHGSFSFDAVGQVEGEAALTKQFVKPLEYAVLIDGAANVSSAATLTYPKPEWEMVNCIGDLAEHRGLYTNLSTGDTSCRQCPVSMATSYNEEEDLRYCKHCNDGSYPYYDGVAVQCVICREGSFNMDPEAQRCERCAPGTYQDEQEQTGCKTCPRGTFTATSGESECQQCPAQTYSKGDERSVCEPCPDAALCADGTITNKETYYLLNADGGEVKASDFVKCVHYRLEDGVRGEACQANGTCWKDEDGHETMTGVLCGQCREGFGKEGLTGLCYKCGDTVVMWFYAILEPLLWGVIANGMVVIVVYTDFSKPKNTWNIIGKQVLSYFHMFTVSAPYLSIHEEVGFESFVNRIVWLEQYVGIDSPLIALRGANCLTSLMFPEARSYQVVIIIAYAYIPVVLMLTYYVFLAARCLGKPIGKRQEILYNPRFVTVCVVYTFFLHHKISKMFISVFRCRNFDNKRRLLLNLEVECLGEEHLRWALAAGAGLVIYCLGIPLLFFAVLHFCHNHKKYSLDEPEVKSALGFLYAGYERRVYWFESVLMLRKITFPILVAVALSLADGGLVLSSSASLEQQEKVYNSIPLMVLVLVSLFFFGLHLIFQPYDNRCYFILDYIESASLWSILLTVTVQVFVIVVSDLRASIKLALFSIVIIAHLLFWALVFWGLFRHIIFELIKEYVVHCIDSKWFTKKVQWLFGGYVKVMHDRLDIHELTGMERDSFSSLIQEIAEKHFESFTTFKYGGIMGTLQCMCLEAHHARDDNPVGVAHSHTMSELSSQIGHVVSRHYSLPKPAPEREFSRSAWEDLVDEGPEFTVETLEMAWLNVASRNSWKEEADANQESVGLGQMVREGVPLTAPGRKGENEDVRSNSGEVSRSLREGGASPVLFHDRDKTSSSILRQKGESTPMSPTADGLAVGGEDSQDEQVPVSRSAVRTQRAAMMRQLAELEAENKKLHLALEVMRGMKDVLKIKIQVARNLTRNKTYYVTAAIKGKAFAGEVQTRAIPYKLKTTTTIQLSEDNDDDWNHEDFLDGYEDGDEVRFVVWAWGKRRAVDVKIGMMDLTAEEVRAALEGEDHTCKKEIQLESRDPAKEPNLQVQILSRFARHSKERPCEGSQSAASVESPEKTLGAQEKMQTPGLPRQGLRRFRIVSALELKVHVRPERMSMTTGTRSPGEIVYGTVAPVSVKGEWLILDHDVGYMLMEHDGELYLEEEAEKAKSETPSDEMVDDTWSALQGPPSGFSEEEAGEQQVLEKPSTASLGSSSGN